jgi:aminopeptidase I
MTKHTPTLRKAASTANFSERSSWQPRMSYQNSFNRPEDDSQSYDSHVSADWCQRPPHPASSLFDQPIPERTLFSGSATGSAARQRPAAPPVPPKVRETRNKGPAKAVVAEDYAQPFCDFLKKNPTVFHTVDQFAKELEDAGFKHISARDAWKLEKGGKYYTTRNGSSLISFTVGDKYEAGNGAAVIAGHIDALTTRLKPVSEMSTKVGYVQMGVSPYAGALNSTWWDRDLGIAGRVLVKEGGKIVQKLVKLDWPIARIPTLAPHFGAVANGPFNKETQMVPIIGLDNSDVTQAVEDGWKTSTLGGQNSFASTQPERLVKAISKELGISDYSSIVNWELELYDVQPATLGGLEKDLLYAGRIDDKICSWAALQGLLNDTANSGTKDSSILKVTAFFDDEEIGSLLRQGARGNFLPSTIERIVDSFRASDQSGTSALVAQTFANSFLVSSDVTHAVNPNFLGAYQLKHAPRLNVGVSVCADSNGHMTTDAVSTALFQKTSDLGGATLQIFQIRSDVRSGGTVGPMLSSATGMRAIDAGIPQLSMHSIRATVGNLDPGLGVQCFQAFLENYEEVDKDFRS